MSRNFVSSRYFTILLCSVISAGAGFALARYWLQPKDGPEKVTTQPSSHTPAEMLRQARAANEQGSNSLKELLAWLIALRDGQQSELDADTRALVHQSVVAFGDARFEPATEFLLKELIEPRVSWRMPPPPLVVSEPKSYFETNPHLLALVKIGGPEMPGRLVHLFLTCRASVRTPQKSPGSNESNRFRLWASKLENGLMEALGTTGMIAGAITDVNKRLFAADLLIDSESVNDLHELKKYLFEHLPK